MIHVHRPCQKVASLPVMKVLVNVQQRAEVKRFESDDNEVKFVP